MTILKRLAVVGFLVIAVSACASRGVKAPKAFTAPDMDFSKVRVVGVFPLFPSEEENQEFSGTFVNTLQEELATRQSQWRLVSYREMLQVINGNSLGTGYKNLQADYNMPGSEMGQLVLSPATRDFVRRLHKATGADAFFMGTYSLKAPPGLGLLSGLKRVQLVRVRVSLLYVPTEESWWTGIVKRAGLSEQGVRDMAASIAANIGKGTLRQL